MNPSAKSIIARSTMLALAALFIWTATSVYQMTRSERIKTRLSIRLDGSDHELVATLPAGRYLIHFTAEPHVTLTSSSAPVPLLPAQITTSVTRKDTNNAIVSATATESISFIITEPDAFRPCLLRVAIARKQPCSIYMNLAPSF